MSRTRNEVARARNLGSAAGSGELLVAGSGRGWLRVSLSGVRQPVRPRSLSWGEPGRAHRRILGHRGPGWAGLRGGAPRPLPHLHGPYRLSLYLAIGRAALSPFSRITDDGRTPFEVRRTEEKRRRNGRPTGNRSFSRRRRRACRGRTTLRHCGLRAGPRLAPRALATEVARSVGTSYVVPNRLAFFTMFSHPLSIQDTPVQHVEAESQRPTAQHSECARASLGIRTGRRGGGAPRNEVLGLRCQAGDQCRTWSSASVERLQSTMTD